MKKSAILSILMLLFALLSACKKETTQGPALNLNASLSIQNFIVGSVQGVINDTLNTVNLIYPFGQDRSALKPIIELPEGAVVSPASGATVNLTKPVTYQVTNGNIFKKYTVTATEQQAIISFKVAGDFALIDNNTRTITGMVPSGTDLTHLEPVIKMAEGAKINPAGKVFDFSNLVIFQITQNGTTIDYSVSITTPENVAFLSTAISPSALTDPDEKAAWTWLKSTNPEASFLSFNDIKAGNVNLGAFTVIWWHNDQTQGLPSMATDPAVLSALKAYYKNGGSFLLTTFGAFYVEALGIVPSGKGPNNGFGDPRGNQWIEPSYEWGISFKGHESHPAFDGLTLTADKAYATAYLLSAGTYRLNHTAQWYIPDWGGYGTTAAWRAQTGGVDLGGTEGDENRTTAVTMAEFTRTDTHGAAIVICGGSYDWYSEANPGNASDQPANTDLTNIQRLTSNVLKYLSK
jgi:hypothetical protein